MKSSKAKSLILLALNLVIVAGVYIFANQMHFLPIMWIYSGIVCVSVCAYIYIYMKNADETAKRELEGRAILSDMERKKTAASKKLLRNMVIIFLPFLIVLFCDYTYLLLLADNHFFKSLMSLIK